MFTLVGTSSYRKRHFNEDSIKQSYIINDLELSHFTLEKYLPWIIFL